MTFKSVQNSKNIGVVVKSALGFSAEIAGSCSLILHSPGNGYYRLKKLDANIIDEGDTLFSLKVDLSDQNQVEFLDKE